jgi:hypothetical protein
MNINPLVVAQILSAIGAVATALAALVEANGLDWKILAPAALFGLAGYFTKRKGDVSLKTHAAKVEQAYELGAKNSVRPPAMPEGDDE